MFKNIVLLIILIVLVPGHAMAAKTVSSPSVEKGVFGIENKGQFEFDDDSNDAWEHELELKYGLTDRIKVELEAKVEKEEGEDLEYAETKLKAKYKMTGQESYINSALQLSYGVNHTGGADDVGVELQMQKKYGRWDHRFNPSLSHEVGSDRESGLSLGLEAGSYYKFDEYKVGMEYFADFGRFRDDLSYSEQKHLLGPAISFDVPVAGYDFEVELGYLVGISDAATDHNFKYVFEVDF